jgi:hypothetical protein
VNDVQSAPTVELPPEWSWCPDCDGTGVAAIPGPEPEDDECWACRGLGGLIDVIF